MWVFFPSSFFSFSFLCILSIIHFLNVLTQSFWSVATFSSEYIWTRTKRSSNKEKKRSVSDPSFSFFSIFYLSIFMYFILFLSFFFVYILSIIHVNFPREVSERPSKLREIIFGLFSPSRYLQFYHNCIYSFVVVFLTASLRQFSLSIFLMIPFFFAIL